MCEIECESIQKREIEGERERELGFENSSSPLLTDQSHPRFSYGHPVVGLAVDSSDSVPCFIHGCMRGREGERKSER